MIKFSDLKSGLLLRVTKIDEAFKMPAVLLNYNQVVLDSIIQIKAQTSYYDEEAARRGQQCYKPTWYGQSPNSNKGLVTNAYVLPNAVEFEEISKATYDKAYEEAIAKQLAEGKLWIPTQTGHMVYTGSDPEIFVVDKRGIVIPAWEFLEAENTPARRIDKLIPFWDGFQAEFNIDPGGCHAQRVDQVALQLKKLLGLARAKFKDARLSPRAVLDIPPDVLQSVSDQHAGLGCSPSKNLYGIKPIQIENPRDLPFRFAGFHIHFQSTHDAILPERIRALDRIAGIISVSLLQGLDDSRRRAYYGRAGEYRTPTHGLEWRVLSSTMLCHPILVNLMFDIARLAQALPAGQYAHLWQVKGGDERVQHIINNYDEVEARLVLKENEPVFKSIINSLYATSRGNNGTGETLVKKVERLILVGCREFIDPNDIEGNWHLNNKEKWTNHSQGKNESVATLDLKGL